VRLVVIFAAVGALLWVIPQSPWRGPILMVLLGLPLAFGLVPRNWFYGMRTPRTMFSSDEVWYIQNRITGIAMVFSGLVWIVVVARR
jgi:hypothetical protein